MSIEGFSPSHDDLYNERVISAIEDRHRQAQALRAHARDKIRAAEADRSAAEVLDDQVGQAVWQFQYELMRYGDDLPRVYRTKLVIDHERKGGGDGSGWAENLDELKTRDRIGREFQLLAEYLADKSEPTPAALVDFRSGKGINFDAKFFEIPANSVGLETRVEQEAGEMGIELKHSLWLSAEDVGLRFKIAENGNDDVQELAPFSTSEGVMISGSVKEHSRLGDDIYVSDKTDEGTNRKRLYRGKVYEDFVMSGLRDEYGPVIFIGNQAVASLAIQLKHRLSGDFVRSSSLSKPENRPTADFIDLIDQKYQR
jgi:hypothetical protein